jgi:hypothetical protein
VSFFDVAKVPAMKNETRSRKPSSSSRKANGFAGPLGKPMVVPKALAVALIAVGAPNGAEAVWQEYRKIIWEMKLERLRLLADELAVDLAAPDAWMKMALALGERFVPGLQIKDQKERGPGAPRKHYLELYIEVLKLTTDGKLTVSNACAVLTKRAGPWKDKNSASLENRFYEIKGRRNTSFDDDPIWQRLEAAAGRS